MALHMMHSAKFAVPLVLVLTLVSCSKREMTVQQMVGNYIATLQTGTDTIVLSSDGTFSEQLVFHNGKKLSNRGAWSLRQGSILLEGILAVGPDSPSPNGFIPKTSVWLPISQLFGKVRSFGAEEWAVFQKL